MEKALVTVYSVAVTKRNWGGKILFHVITEESQSRKMKACLPFHVTSEQESLAETMEGCCLLAGSQRHA